MVERSPATVTRPVRALGAAVHDLRTERHEPDKPRGLRPDLWGTAGEIPAVYPAMSCRPACEALVPGPAPSTAGGDHVSDDNRLPRRTQRVRLQSEHQRR